MTDALQELILAEERRKKLEQEAQIDRSRRHSMCFLWVAVRVQLWDSVVIWSDSVRHTRMRVQSTHATANSNATFTLKQYRNTKDPEQTADIHTHTVNRITACHGVLLHVRRYEATAVSWHGIIFFHRRNSPKASDKRAASYGSKCLLYHLE